MVNERIFGFIKDTKKRGMGKDTHREVMSIVFDAPINLFFDVTPIGLIINRIRGDIHVFRGCLIEVPGWICDMSSHFIYILLLFISMNSFELVLTLLIVYWLIYKVAMPMIELRSQVDKIGHVIHSPIDSYFHESMRGINVIRAFGTSEQIIAK